MGLFSSWKSNPRKQDFDGVGRGYWECPGMDEELREGVSLVNGEKVVDYSSHENRQISDRDGANLISSLCEDGMHRPVLDLDIPTQYFPSSTPEHAHLYIDHPLTWEQYEKVLAVLGEVGILEAGYVGAALSRKATFVRPKWVKKPEKETP